jgi:hypothetical protein
MDGIFFVITFDGIEDHVSEDFDFFDFFGGEFVIFGKSEQTSSTDKAKLFFGDFDREGFHGSSFAFAPPI